METRKYNFDRPFVGLDGKPLLVKGEAVIMSERLGFILFNLSSMNNQLISQEKKYQAYKLMRKIQAGGEIELSQDEKEIIKDAASDAFSVGAYGQIIDILGE